MKPTEKIPPVGGGIPLRRGPADGRSCDEADLNKFADWQPVYAGHGIATFPVGKDKKPTVRGYLRTTLPASEQFALNFPSAEAFGFALGPRSNITVLDVDTPDERVLADAMSRHGDSPIIVRSGSGNHQAWYRHSGERRHVRLWPDKPIDLLGGGYVVAPPSKGSRGPYEFLQGSLDDLDHLPTLRQLETPSAPSPSAKIDAGGRNDALWQRCMKQAHHCDNFDALLDVARTFNDQALLPPLPDEEVVKAATSAWGYTERGQNRFGQTGAWLPTSEVDLLLPEPDVLVLLTFLRAHNGRDSEFMITNTLSMTFGWGRPRITTARRRLVDLGYIEKTRWAKQHQPALFRWKRQGVGNRTPILN